MRKIVKVRFEDDAGEVLEMLLGDGIEISRQAEVRIEVEPEQFGCRGIVLRFTSENDATDGRYLYTHKVDKENPFGHWRPISDTEKCFEAAADSIRREAEVEMARTIANRLSWAATYHLKHFHERALAFGLCMWVRANYEPNLPLCRRNQIAVPDDLLTALLRSKAVSEAAKVIHWYEAGHRFATSYESTHPFVPFVP